MSMVRSVWAALGIVGTAVLVLVALGAPLLGAHASGSGLAAPTGPRATPSHATLSPLAKSEARPSAALPIWSSVNVTDNYTAPTAPPIWVNFTVTTYGVPLNVFNLTLGISITAGDPSTLISNTSVAVVNGQASYSIPFDYFGIGGYITLPQSNYTFIVWSTVNATIAGNPAAQTNQSNPLTVATMLVDNPDLVYTNTISVYNTLPIQVNFSFTLNASNSGISDDANNVTVGLLFEYTTGSNLGPAVLANETLPFSASGAYQVTINDSVLGVIGYNGGDYPAGAYAIIPWATVINSANTSFPSRSVEAERQITFSATLPTVQVVAPLPTTSGLQVGQNVTVVGAYSGNFITGATITITSQASNSVVYTQGIFVPGGGAKTGFGVWVPGSPGLYTVTVSVTVPYASSVSASVTNVSVAAAGSGGSGTVYLNTTTWHNTSLLGGLSQGTAAAVLLVVGLVIGMIVALALGRMMWSSPKPAGAQPWSASKGGTGGANECPVCHQSFKTPEELAEHSKQAHGMS